MEYIKAVFGKKQIKLAIAGAVSLLVGLILVLVGVKTTGKLSDQQLAKRWSDNNDYAQVSAFFSELSGFNTDSVTELLKKIESKLDTDSITANENARRFVYAYSAMGEASVVSERTTVKVNAIGVGGDYFLFHPLTLISGSFFSEDSLNQDLVVVDRETAWQLFGSTDIVGQMVEIGGVYHEICAVVERESGRLNELAGNDGATVYMSYSSLSKNGTVTYINCFEALMPNPLTGYALGVLTDNMPVDGKRFETVENTGRFYWTKLLKNVKNFGTRGMNQKGVVYPYWENIARAYEDYLTPVTVIAILSFAFPAVLLLLLLLRMWRLRTVHFSDIKDYTERRLELFREKRKKMREGEIYDEA